MTHAKEKKENVFKHRNKNINKKRKTILHTVTISLSHCDNLRFGVTFLNPN